MPTCLIVIPCFNEENRLDSAVIDNFIKTNTDFDLLFVNDGSEDKTAKLLREISVNHKGRVYSLELEQNSGKAEAIRAGVLNSEQLGDYTYLAYLDADFSTLPDEIEAMVRLMEDNKDIDGVFGARIKMLGTHIKRHPIRHILGRIFATYAYYFIRSDVYDTQCGAKTFRYNAGNLLFKDPFISKWLFDVELLYRSRRSNLSIVELPLNAWSEIGGSKLRLMDFVNAPFEMIRIHRFYSNQ